MGDEAKRVLLVDADTQVHEVVGAHLRSLGLEVVVAADSERAIEILFEENIDILLADLRMPGRDGLSLIDFVRGASPHTRCLLMGKSATAKDYKAAVALGAVDLIAKPFDPDELETAIRKASERLDGYHGSIHGLSLPDLLQAYALSRSSITIEVGAEGRIYVVGGEVVHAEAGASSGLEALRRLIDAKSGRIQTSSASSDVSRTIHGRLDHILLTIQAAKDTPGENNALEALASGLVEARDPPQPVEPTATDVAEKAFFDSAPPAPAAESRSGGSLVLAIAALAILVGFGILLATLG